jgi:hypothetical protein
MLLAHEKLRIFLQEVAFKYDVDVKEAEDTLMTFSIMAAHNAKKAGLESTAALVLHQVVNSSGAIRDGLQETIAHGKNDAKALMTNPEYFIAVMEFDSDFKEFLEESKAGAA